MLGGVGFIGRIGQPSGASGASDALSLSASYTHPADGTDTSGGYAAGSVSPNNGAAPFAYSRVSGDTELTVNVTTGAVTRTDGGDGVADYGEVLTATMRVTDDNGETADRVFTSTPTPIPRLAAVDWHSMQSVSDDTLQPWATMQRRYNKSVAQIQGWLANASVLHALGDATNATAQDRIDDLDADYAAWKTAALADLQAILPYETASNKYWIHCGNEFSGPGFPGSTGWNDVATVGVIAEYFIAPIWDLFNSAGATPRMIGPSSVSMNGGAQTWTTALLDYEFVGTFVLALTGQTVRQVLQSASHHYHLDRDDWRTHNPYVEGLINSGLASWDTEEMPASETNAGLAGQLALKVFARGYGWASEQGWDPETQYRLNLWADLVLRTNRDEAMQALFDVIGTGTVSKWDWDEGESDYNLEYRVFDYGPGEDWIIFFNTKAENSSAAESGNIILPGSQWQDGTYTLCKATSQTDENLTCLTYEEVTITGGLLAVSFPDEFVGGWIADVPIPLRGIIFDPTSITIHEGVDTLLATLSAVDGQGVVTWTTTATGCEIRNTDELWTTGLTYGSETPQVTGTDEALQQQSDTIAVTVDYALSVMAAATDTVTDGDAAKAVGQATPSNAIGTITYSLVGASGLGIHSTTGVISSTGTAAWGVNPSATAIRATDDFDGSTADSAPFTVPVLLAPITSIQGVAITANVGDDPATKTSALTMTGGMPPPVFATTSNKATVAGSTLTMAVGLDEDSGGTLPISVIDDEGQTDTGTVSLTVSAITLAQSHAGSGWQMWEDPNAAGGYRGIALDVDAIGRWVAGDTIPTDDPEATPGAEDFVLLGTGASPQQTNDHNTTAADRLAIYSTAALNWGATGGAWTEVSGVTPRPNELGALANLTNAGWNDLQSTDSAISGQTDPDSGSAAYRVNNNNAASARQRYKANGHSITPAVRRVLFGVKFQPTSGANGAGMALGVLGNPGSEWAQVKWNSSLTGSSDVFQGFTNLTWDQEDLGGGWARIEMGFDETTAVTNQDYNLELRNNSGNQPYVEVVGEGRFFYELRMEYATAGDTSAKINGWGT